MKSQPAVGVRRAVRAGLGLPRPADRAGGGEEARQGRRQAGRRRVPPEVPRVRRRADRHPAPRLQAPGRAGRLGQPVPHDGFPLRGGHAACAGEDRRARPPAARRQAGALVLRLRLGTGRGGDRIRRQGVAGDRRGLRRAPAGQAGGCVRRAGGRGRRGRHADLDHHAVDAAGQPGGVRRRRPGLRAGRGPGVAVGRPSAAGAGRGAGRARAGTLPRRDDGRAGSRHRRRTGRAETAASLLRRARDPRTAGRARLGRGRHRRGAHGARPWPGGLRGVAALRPARRTGGLDPQPGGRARRVPAVDAARRWGGAGRPAHLEGQRRHRRGTARQRHVARLRAAQPQLPALLAPQDAGGVPRHAAVVHLDGAGQPAPRRAGAGRAGEMGARMG